MPVISPTATTTTPGLWPPWLRRQPQHPHIEQVVIFKADQIFIDATGMT